MPTALELANCCSAVQLQALCLLVSDMLLTDQMHNYHLGLTIAVITALQKTAWFKDTLCCR